jgi:hypothetical protein
MDHDIDDYEKQQSFLNIIRPKTEKKEVDLQDNDFPQYFKIENRQEFIKYLMI